MIHVFIWIEILINAFDLLFHKGGYGFVFAAQDTTTGKEYALKVQR